MLLLADTMNVGRFRRLLHAVLLSGPCAVAGCSSMEDPTPMPERAQCPNLRGADRYAALTLSPGIDGIAFATRASDAEPAPAPSAQRLASLGTPCATATDRDACLARVDALLGSAESEGFMVNLEPGCSGFCGLFATDLAAVTAGDDVRLAKLEDVLAAATPVDDRDEAAAFLLLQGRAIDCGGNNARPEADGWTFKHTGSSCSGAVWETFNKVVAATGEVVYAGRRVLSDEDNGCVEGRRPSDLAPTGIPWLASASACFSEIAHMEAAAVLAFEELERELDALGAPDDLLARVRRARADEIAHAEVTAALAAKHGGSVPAPRVLGSAGPRTVRPVMALALENAREGCLREAYGALVAAYQAAHASDPEVRAAFAKIALDEAEHAELSFALDAWLVAQLGPEERRDLERARASALDALAAACAVESAREVRVIAGMPSAHEAQALLARLVWAGAEAA